VNGVEFVCDDCRCGVFAVGTDRVPDPPLCSICQHLREFQPEPHELEPITALLRRKEP
jgi:hypothetical protein